MVENSQDILNIVKSISIALVAGLFSWFIFYLVMIVRQAFKLVKGARDKIQKIDYVISKFGSKLGEGVSGFIYIAEGVKLLIESINKKKTKKKVKTTKKK